MNGWIKIHRRLSDNPIWTCEPFTRGQAWIDLLMLANYEDSFFYVRNIKVDVKRGQVAWSEPKLAERWGWSRTKLRKFLKDLEKEQQLIQQKNNVTQIITIIKYEEYQNKEQQQDSRKTAARRIKEDKEGKESNIEWRKNFENYVENLRKEYKKILEDEKWIQKQMELNPNLDVRKSIEKSCVNFWGTKEGWEHKKKKSKSQDINWYSTLANSLSLPNNKVYLQK